MLLAHILLAHLLGDFLMQPSSWVAEKENRKALSPKLYLHVLIHLALLLIATWQWDFWPYAVGIAVIHLLVDIVKLYAQRPSTRNRWFFIDQCIHVLVLFGAWYLYTMPHTAELMEWPQSTVYVVLTVVLLSHPTSVVLQVLLSNFSPERSKQSSLANAGKYIGMLERLLILLFVLIGQWAGVGFLLAAKSIFRFGDLKEAQDRKLTEYIMIGTLMSFGIAIVCALLLKMVWRLL